MSRILTFSCTIATYGSTKIAHLFLTMASRSIRISAINVFPAPVGSERMQLSPFKRRWSRRHSCCQSGKKQGIFGGKNWNFQMKKPEKNGKIFFWFLRNYQIYYFYRIKNAIENQFFHFFTIFVKKMFFSNLIFKVSGFFKINFRLKTRFKVHISLIYPFFPLFFLIFKNFTIKSVQLAYPFIRFHIFCRQTFSWINRYIR